jgi:hypothetical protein
LPGASDDPYITNTTSSTGISITNATVTVNSFTMSNSTAGAVTTLIISNSTLSVAGDTVLGSNAVVELGRTGGTVGTQRGGTLSTVNLYMNAGSVLDFNKSFTGQATNSFLIVSGTFTNTSQSIIRQTGNGGSVRLLFSDTTKIVSNQGTIDIQFNSNAGGTPGFTLQVGDDTTANTFYNQGTVTTTFSLSTGTQTRNVFFSNLFVNAGLFVFSNANAQAATFNMTTTKGVTNEAAGTFKIFNGSTAAGVANSLTITTGDFVNRGTLDLRGNASIRENRITLSSGAFSNAAGGQLIISSANSGINSIYADRIVNAGTNVINAGTLAYRTAAGAATALENSGTVLLGGGNLDVNTFTNTATGTIKVTGGTGTLSGSTLVNAGVVSLASGGTFAFNGLTLSNAATAVFNNTGGTVKLTGTGSDFLLTGGTGSNTFNFGSGTLLFNAAASGIHTLGLGGFDQGSSLSASNNNYLISNLNLTGGAGFTLQLAGDAGQALYVDNLYFLTSGSTLDLNGFKIYFSGTTNGLDGVSIINGTSADIILLGSAPPIVTVVNFTQGGPGTFNFDDPGNWDASGDNPTNAYHDVRFTIANANNITVTQNTAAVSFSVTSMTVSNSSTGERRLVLGRNQTWMNGVIGSQGVVQMGYAGDATAKSLTLDATLTINNGGTFLGAGTISGGALIVNAGGTVLATNIFGSGIVTQHWTSASAVTMNGSLTAKENAVAQFDATLNNGGAIVLNGGILVAGGALNNAGAISLTGGGALVANGALNNNSGGTISGGGEISGSQLANALGATVTADDAGTALRFTSGNTVGNFGILIATNGGTLTFGSVAGSALITNANLIRLFDGTLRTGRVINQGVIDATNGTLTLIQNPVLTGTASVRSDGTLKFGGAAELVATNAGILNLMGGAVVTADLYNQGNIVSVDGGLISNALINAAGAFITATNGTLVVTPDLINFGTVTNGHNSAANTATITVGSDGTGSVTNSGTIRLGIAGGGAGVFNSGQITNTGAIIGFGTMSGQILNTASGIIETTNGTLRLLTSPVQNGTIRVAASSSTLSIGAAGTGALVNNGYVSVIRGTLVAGTLTNTISGVLTNDALTAAANGTIAANIVNLGRYNIANGTANLTIGLTNAASGFIINSATLNVTPNWTNVGAVTNTGTISGGLLRNAGTLVSIGTIGSVDNTSGGAWHITNGTTAVLGELRNTGTILVEGGPTLGQLTVGSSSANDFTNSATGTVRFDGRGTISFSDLRNAGTILAASSGTLAFTGTGSSFTNTGTIVFLTGGGTLQFIGNSAGMFFDNLGVIRADPSASGTVTFGNPVGTGSQNYTNTASGLIINTNSAVTLQAQAANDRFNNLGKIVVGNGGTFTVMNTGASPGSWMNGGTLVIGTADGVGIVNSGTLANNGAVIAMYGGGTLNMGITDGEFRNVTTASGSAIIVSNGAVLTITQLSAQKWTQTGGRLEVDEGATLKLYTDRAAQTNAFVSNTSLVDLRGGTLISATLSNLTSGIVTGRVAGSGTLLLNNAGLGVIGSNLFNAGIVSAYVASASAPVLHIESAYVFNQTNALITANNGLLNVTGVVTNRGTVNFINSVGTFNAEVVNQGAWISDPSTNVFNSTMFVDTNGYIAAAAGDVYLFKSNFVNISRRSNDYNTLQSKFVFDAGTNLTLGSSYTQAFYVAGIDLLGSNLTPVGPLSPTNAFVGDYADAVIGYSNNFALGTLEIGNAGTNTSLVLIDSFGTVGDDDGRKAGLYLNTLTLFGDSVLIISNNVEVYWMSTNNVFLDGPNQNVFLLGNASFHQLSLVPEPSVLMFLMFGGVVLAFRRARRCQARA